MVRMKDSELIDYSHQYFTEGEREVNVRRASFSLIGEKNKKK